MTTEVTTLGLGVNTSQVVAAKGALEQMAGAGKKAETAATALEKAFAGLSRGGAAPAEASIRRLGESAASASTSLLAITRTGVGVFLGSQLVGSVKDATAALYEASAAGERLRTMLNFASAGNGAKEIEFLRTVTQRLGLQFQSTATAYGQFQAAAKGTALEGQKARDIFESVAKASAVMGLSTEQSTGALLALQQMISKGTVQAEELRGQLGERLPGAFQIAARAMGVTTAELGKMLEAGEVIADDFLPKFARALNENLGGAAEQAAGRLDAAVNRFSNAWDRLKQSIGDSGFANAARNDLTGLSAVITTLTERMESARASGGGMLRQLSEAGGAGLAIAGFKLLESSSNLLNGAINSLTGDVLGLNENLSLLPTALRTNAEQSVILAEKLKAAEAEFAALQARGAEQGYSIYYKNELANLAALIAKIKEAQQEKSRLQGNDPIGGGRGLINPPTVGEEAARLQGVQTAMQKVLSGISGVKDSFYKDLNALYAGYQNGLIQLPEYQKAVAKLIEEDGGGKANKAGIAKAASEAEQIRKASLAGSLQDIEAGLRSQVEAYKNAEAELEATRAAGLVDEKSYYDFKRTMIDLTSSAEVKALEDQNARLAKEKVSGDDRIKNLSEIGRNEQEIARIRAKAASDTRVLATQETAAINQRTLSMNEARKAAEEYIATMQRANARDLAAFGMGDRGRDIASGRNQIDDQYQSRRDRLAEDLRRGQLGAIDSPEAKARYDAELALINEFNEKALQSYQDRIDNQRKLEGDASLGANRAIENYLDNARNVAKQTEDLYTRTFGSIEDALVQFATTGKFNFKSFADTVVAELVRIQVKAAILRATEAGKGGGGFFDIFKAFVGLAGAGGGLSIDTAGIGITNASTGSLASLGLGAGRANGGPVYPNTLHPVNERGPELLTVGNKQFLMMGAQGGKVTPNSELGGMGGGINVINQTAGRVDKATWVPMPDGERALLIQQAADAAERRITNSLSNPNSRMSRSQQRNFKTERNR